MSEDEEHSMGESDSLYDLGEATFTLNKRVEAFVSERYPGNRYRSTTGEALTERLVGRRSSHDVPGPSLSSFETLSTKCSWTREEENCEKHASSFHDLGKRLVGRRSSHDVPGPSLPSFETLGTKCSWIREEENCEEHASSFHDLDSYSPQLTTPTKIRAKRPGVHGREKRNSASDGQPNTTEKWVEQGTPGLSDKELTQETHGDLRKTHPIDDTSHGAHSSVYKKDNVSSLKERFEQMSD